MNRKFFTDTLTIQDTGITKTGEGFLVIPANFTRTGVFDYTSSHGVKMLRAQDEVFKPASTVTLVGKSVTVQHPTGEVTPKNWKRLEVGQVLDVAQNGDFLSGSLIIKDSKTIKFIEDAQKKGKSIELSCGYDAQIVDSVGTHKDGDYQAEQKDIRYNHIAIVTKGRAGASVKMLIDSLTQNEVKRMKKQVLKHFIDVADDDGVIIDAINAEIEADKKKLIDSDTKCATLETANKALADELDALKAVTITDVQIEEKAKEIAHVQGLCDSFRIERKDLDVDGMKKKLIDHFLPSLKIEDKEDAYLDAAWDATSELAVKAKEANDKKGVKIGDTKEVKETVKFKDEVTK